MDESRKKEICKKIEEINNMLNDEANENNIACVLNALQGAIIIGERHLEPLAATVAECAQSFIDDLEGSFEPENNNIH